MHILLHKVEKLVDSVIGPLLAVLLVVILAEIFLHEQFEAVSAYADYFDMFLISVFAVDLAFKFHRVRKFPRFLRKYWLEVMATIPFFLVFRFTELFGLNLFIERGQEIVHEVPEIQKLEKETAGIVREAGRAGRTARLIRTFRIASRLPRFLGAIPFFEKPTGKHHLHEKKK